MEFTLKGKGMAAEKKLKTLLVSAEIHAKIKDAVEKDPRGPKLHKFVESALVDAYEKYYAADQKKRKKASGE